MTDFIYSAIPFGASAVVYLIVSTYSTRRKPLREKLLSKSYLILGGFMLTAMIALSLSAVFTLYKPTHAADTSSPHASLSCSKDSQRCVDVYDSEKVFGKDVYVGHDEPSTLFYSNAPGSGNQMRYELIRSILPAGHHSSFPVASAAIRLSGAPLSTSTASPKTQ